MAATLSISELQSVLAVLVDVTTPYQLGIQLKVDSSELKAIEKNHPRDIDRQKTEVIEYWLRNSPDASWITLASAVERMGGHARLVKTLRMFDYVYRSQAMGRSSAQGLERSVSRCGSYCAPVSEEEEEHTLTECMEGAPFTILILGKSGHGKSTIGNRLLNRENFFHINCRTSPQTCDGSAILKSKSRHKSYKIDVYDHKGYFQYHWSIERLSSDLPTKLDLVLFVLRHDSEFISKEEKKLNALMNEWQISRISSLILTHCERLSEEEREKMIKQFRKDHPSVAELMGKGILAVGFPDSSHIQPGSPMSQRVENDYAKLRQLIYSCNEGVFIPKADNNSQHLDSDDTTKILPQEHRLEVAQCNSSEDESCCCSIL